MAPTDQRLAGLSHQELWGLAHGGDPAAASTSQINLSKAGQMLEDIARTLDAPLAEFGLGWRGQAADAARGGIDQHARWAESAAARVHAAAAQAERQAASARTVIAQMPPPAEPPASDAADWAGAEEVRANARLRALELMERHAAECAATQPTGTFPAPSLAGSGGAPAAGASGRAPARGTANRPATTRPLTDTPVGPARPAVRPGRGAPGARLGVGSPGARLDAGPPGVDIGTRPAAVPPSGSARGGSVGPGGPADPGLAPARARRSALDSSATEPPRSATPAGRLAESVSASPASLDRAAPSAPGGERAAAPARRRGAEPTGPAELAPRGTADGSQPAPGRDDTGAARPVGHDHGGDALVVPPMPTVGPIDPGSDRYRRLDYLLDEIDVFTEDGWVVPPVIGR
jgi:hypothetical protein